jgi:hypothetical protein
LAVDSDLAEAVEALKAVFQLRKIHAVFGTNDDEAVRAVKKSLALTRRYCLFLKAADPRDVESATPTERIRFIPLAALEREQIGYGRGDAQTAAISGWKEGWVVIGHSALLGDPYFLDTTRPDAEGDCPVMTAMSGAEHKKPTLCASSFACFLKIVATAMEVAKDFARGAADPDDEDIFREAIGPKIRVIDGAALREGHWT